MKGTCDELLHQIHEMGVGTGDCLTCLQKKFISHSPEAAKSCRDKIAAIRAKAPEIVKAIEHSEREKSEKERIKDVSRHFLRICEHLEDLADTLHKKARENILFSDRGVTEVCYLFQTLGDILRATADLILVQNPILIRYVLESEAVVEKVTIEYATQHEERLIEGLCLPLASPIYLRILDTFKGIAREAKGIAEKMSS
jgi:Na+/phosphate symporter